MLMTNLIRQLAEHYPDWRKHHNTPEEAAVEVGLLDESELVGSELRELDFSDDSYTEFDTPETDYD